MSLKESLQQRGIGREIPTRRVVVDSASQLPPDYSTTPGGSIFSTTPGGTRILYERSFLLKCRNSPLTKSPPANMAKIPGVTVPGEVDMPKENGLKENLPVHPVGSTKTGIDEQPQFEMDM